MFLFSVPSRGEPPTTAATGRAPCGATRPRRAPLGVARGDRLTTVDIPVVEARCDRGDPNPIPDKPPSAQRHRKNTSGITTKPPGTGRSRRAGRGSRRGRAMDRLPAPVDRSIGPALRELLDASPKAVRRALQDRRGAEGLDGGKRAKKEETRRLVSSLDALARFLTDFSALESSGDPATAHPVLDPLLERVVRPTAGRGPERPSRGAQIDRRTRRRRRCDSSRFSRRPRERRSAKDAKTRTTRFGAPRPWVKRWRGGAHRDPPRDARDSPRASP